jgi:hypothetical protein
VKFCVFILKLIINLAEIFYVDKQSNEMSNYAAEKYGQAEKFYFINSDGLGLGKSGCLGYFQTFFIPWHFSLIFKL